MTGPLIKQFRRAFTCLFLLGLAVVLLHAADKKESIPSGVVQDFLIPEFYPDNINQPRSLVRGKKARDLKKGELYLLESGSVELFYKDGRTNLVIQAPEAIWNPKTKIVSSSNRMEAVQGTNAFKIRGEGFSWGNSNRTLFISNQVETVIDKARLQSSSSKKTTPPETLEQDPTKDDLTITSERFQFEHATGIAIYEGSVVAKDSQKTVQCDRMRVEFLTNEGETQNEVKSIRAEGSVRIDMKTSSGAGRARSPLAIYRKVDEQDVLELTGSPTPTWETDEYNGQGDVLLVFPEVERFQSKGNAILRFPRREKITDKEGKVEEKVHQVVITSNENDLEMGTVRKATFMGNVKTRDPLWQLDCDHLSAFLAKTNSEIERVEAKGKVVVEREIKKENQPVVKSVYRAQEVTAEINPQTGEIKNILAVREVTFDQGVHSARGEKAVHSVVEGQEMLKLTGNPTWKTEEAEGSGDSLQFQQDLFKVVGNARFKRLNGEVPPPTTTAAAAGTGNKITAPNIAKSNVEVTCHDYEYDIKKGEGIFRKDVLAKTEQMKLMCGLLTVNTAEDRKSFEKLVALDNVVIEKDKLKSTSRHALYLAGPNTLQLTGDPVLVLTNGTVIHADPLVWDLTKNRATGRSYRMTGPFENLAPRVETPKPLKKNEKKSLK